MPNEDNKILEYNHGEKSMKAPFIVYADLESLLEKMGTCYEKSPTTKTNKHIPAGYSLFTHCSFDETKNMLNHNRGKNCMNKFCRDLRKHATKLINYEKKRNDTSNKRKKKKKYHKVKDHCHYTGKYRGAAHDICNLRYKAPKEIPVVFHNGSTYDYHFIIKELAEEFEGEFECLGENTEKYITFSVSIKKEIRKKDRIIKKSYKIKLIDSFRFMSTSLSDLVDNISEGLHKCIDCELHLDYMSIKDNQLIFRCFRCKKNYEKDFNKELIKRFANTYRFCNKDLNKFILLLGKGVYPFEYLDNWERFDETLLPNKEAFYSNLNMEDITDADYRHENKVFNEFKLKH